MSRAKVIAAIDAIPGAELFETDAGPRGVNLTAWTPARVAWVSNGSHCLAEYDATVARAAYVALLVRINHGTEECTIRDCDSCEGL